MAKFSCGLYNLVRSRSILQSVDLREDAGAFVSQSHCAVTECTSFVHGQGLCAKHYKRLRRLGRLTLPTTAERFWARVDRGRPDNCWEWQGARTSGGYGKYFNENAHREAWRLAYGQDVPEGLFVLHHCDNPPCCNPRHLYVGTTQQNSRDAVVRGRLAHQQGEAHGMAKLTDDAVRDIRQRVEAGEVQRRLAEEYGVSPSTINLIVKGRHWTHVAEAEALWGE